MNVVKVLRYFPGISYQRLVAEMVRNDLEVARRDALVKQAGYKVLDYHE